MFIKWNMEELRKRHNVFKRELIESVTNAGSHILDVGCGRGGDLQKWRGCNVAGINMCDPCEQSLAEAKRRAKNMKIRVNFYHGDIHSTPHRKFDVICFNFSLHYIFETKELFTSTIKEIKARAKKNTILCGIIPDSHRITMRAPINLEDGSFFVLKKPGDGGFGEYCYVHLADTLYYENGAIKEPIAYKDLLITHLEDAGFELKTWEPLTGSPISELYTKFLFTYTR